MKDLSEEIKNLKFKFKDIEEADRNLYEASYVLKCMEESHSYHLRVVFSDGSQIDLERHNTLNNSIKEWHRQRVKQLEQMLKNRIRILKEDEK